MYGSGCLGLVKVSHDDYHTDESALNVELFDAIQHASYLLYRNAYNNLWAKAAMDK